MSFSSVANTIFGGSNKKETQEQGNLAYPFIMENYGASGAGAFNNALGGLQSTLESNPQQV